jgi:hypothetical protein
MDQSSSSGKRRVNIKSVFDVLMGCIYAVVGLLLVFSKIRGQRLSFPPPEMVLIFGIISVAYGAFRIFRGIKTFHTI